MSSTNPTATVEAPEIPGTGADLLARFIAVRGQTDRLCEPLEPEDFVVQSMPDASPAKWHLAHTSWFFETFVLSAVVPDYRSPDPRYNYRGEGQAYAPRPDPRYDPRIYSAPPTAAAPRRGGYMGQGGQVINDYDRYRLRPPPPGYDWVQTSRGAALVSRSTRQIFDVVPY